MFSKTGVRIEKQSKLSEIVAPALISIKNLPTLFARFPFSKKRRKAVEKELKDGF